ncbi:MAG: DHA2 family efflux MFS transporter permease subunit, partial [Mycobacterium sp.]|nr:DHA2 family efflux MFS transporter permease subunit [Mycobacterium sp.]
MNVATPAKAAASDPGVAGSTHRSTARLSSGRKVLGFGLMCLGCFIAFLDIQIVSASSQQIGVGLSASQDELSWVQTSYLIAEIIVIPLSGWLSRVMSTRWLVAASAAGFTAASVLCASAWDLDSMIVFRALQGFFGGSMIPTAYTASVILFAGKQKAVAASFVTAAAGLAPTVGPVMGGWITDSWSWQWLFYVNIVPGMLVASLVPILVRIDKPDLTLLKGADYLSIVLMAVSLGCLDYVLEEGARWDWFGDDTIRTCAWISGLTGIGFIIRCLTFACPVVDLRALASRNFALGCWFSFVTGVGQFSMIYLIPTFLASVRGFDPWQIGVAILSAGIFQLCTIPIYSVFANRVDLRWLLMFGLACYGISMWLFTSMMNQWGWREMLLPLAFRGLASPFSSPSTVTLTLGGLPPDRLKSASGLFSLMRSLGGALGIAACATILNDRTNLHFLRIAEHWTSANAQFMNLLHRIAARYTQVSGDSVSGQAAALKKLWLLAHREAQVQAFADAFLAIALCFAVCVPMVPLMRRLASPASPGFSKITPLAAVPPG